MTRQTSFVLCSFAAFFGQVVLGDIESIYRLKDSTSKLSRLRLQNVEHEGASCESHYFCIAHLDKVFTRMPTATLDDTWDKADSQAWLESNQQGSEIWSGQGRIMKAWGVFHLYDMNRGIKILFDAR